MSAQILSKWNPGGGCTWDLDTLVPWPLPAASHLWHEVLMEAKKVCWSETCSLYITLWRQSGLQSHSSSSVEELLLLQALIRPPTSNKPITKDRGCGGLWLASLSHILPVGVKDEVTEWSGLRAGGRCDPSQDNGGVVPRKRRKKCWSDKTKKCPPHLSRLIASCLLWVLKVMGEVDIWGEIEGMKIRGKDIMSLQRGLLRNGNKELEKNQKDFPQLLKREKT